MLSSIAPGVLGFPVEILVAPLYDRPLILYDRTMKRLTAQANRSPGFSNGYPNAKHTFTIGG